MDNFKNVIGKYIEKRASEDLAFAKKYEQKNNDIEGCCRYIITEVQKMNRKGFTDDEIFGMAVHYFDEDAKAPDKVPGCKVVVGTSTLPEEERKKLDLQAKEQAAEEYLKNRKSEEQRKIANRERSEKEARKKAEEAFNKRMEEEGNLFGGLFD